MGLAYPLSLALVAAAWITVVVGVIVSWFFWGRFVLRQRLWRCCLAISCALSLLPGLLFVSSMVSDIGQRYFSPMPLLLLLAACVGPCLCVVLLRQSSKAAARGLPL
jgi:hypothetical protein